MSEDRLTASQRHVQRSEAQLRHDSPATSAGFEISALAVRNSEEAPPLGDSLEHAASAVPEVDARADYELFHGAGY